MDRQLVLPKNENRFRLLGASLLVWGSIAALIGWGVMSAYPALWWCLTGATSVDDLVQSPLGFPWLTLVDRFTV